MRNEERYARGTVGFTDALGGVFCLDVSSGLMFREFRCCGVLLVFVVTGFFLMKKSTAVQNCKVETVLHTGADDSYGAL